jgi:four helix bundle protein
VRENAPARNDWDRMKGAAMPVFVMSSTTIRSYRDLQVWHKAMDLVESAYRATSSFPTAERYGLVSQIRRASISVVSNIAEGHARSRGDFVRFLYMAAGSLTELETQIELSIRLQLMSNDQARPVLQICDDVGRMVGSLRRRIQARRSLGPRP